MVLQKFAHTRKACFGASWMLMSCLLTFGAQADCELPPEEVELIEHYRSDLSSGNVAGLSGSIHYPVTALVGGSVVTIFDEPTLSWSWDLIATDDFLTFVRNSDACSLKAGLALNPVSLTIGSLKLIANDK